MTDKTLKQQLSINLANLFLERHILVPEKTFNTIIECVLKTGEIWLTEKRHDFLAETTFKGTKYNYTFCVDELL